MSLSSTWLVLVRVPDPLAPKASEAGTCLLGWSFHLTSDRGKEDADKDGPGGVHVDDHQVPLVAPSKVPLCLVLAVRDHVALKQEVYNWCLLEAVTKIFSLNKVRNMVAKFLLHV